MSQELAKALKDRQALSALTDSEGWGVYCARFDALMKELESDIFDTAKTPAAEAEILRQARARIVSKIAPRILLADLLKKLEATAKRELPPQQFHPDSP